MGEGRYNSSKSFLWNLIFYKQVDYPRVIGYWESEKIHLVLNVRACLLMFFIGVLPIITLVFIKKFITG